MAKKGFSIDLGPDLDPPGTAEWGYMEDEDPEGPVSPDIRIKRDRSSRKISKKLDRKHAGAKPVPPREVPAPPEIAEAEAADPDGPDVASELARDISLDAIQQIAEANCD